MREETMRDTSRRIPVRNGVGPRKNFLEAINTAIHVPAKVSQIKSLIRRGAVFTACICIWGIWTGSYLGAQTDPGGNRTAEPDLHGGLSADDIQETQEQVEFRFRYQEGERYRILSTVQQDVAIDGRYSHSAEILNRVAVETVGTDNGSGEIHAVFQTSESATRGSEVFEWGEEYESRFLRDQRGYYDIAPEYFMPVVRDVPVFPEEPVEPGDTWTATGNEVHDFRRNFGIPEAFHFPIPVTYQYLGQTEKDGRDFDLIAIRYNVYHRPGTIESSRVYPTTITGFSDQVMHWDRAAGKPYYYEETYGFLFHLSNGMVAQYSGTAVGKVLDSPVLDRVRTVEEISQDLDDLGVSDATVTPDERGVTISLEDVRFYPDSSELLPGERDKLSGIAGILKKYGDRDILITGHTALAGTEEGRQRLSEERARAVGQYLLDADVRTPESIVTRGMGAQEPVAGNDTEEGRRRNRRVEITILEN
jgi:outer membrane protein OmpA-like peptidoglycan-associated protein